ncbi:DUF4381 domain-containing protein [Limibacter armeniacum]|uniref:DUF4381 domain-containing protein n=1 Tax=Limibacter armeniacum TaxID=466084 RepID=UPI002FE689FE
MQQDPIQIGELIEPTPIGFSFGAPGWYVLLGLIFLIGSLVALRIWLQYKRNQYRRDALKHLKLMTTTYYVPTQSNQLAFETVMLLKRITAGLYGRRKVAALRGTQWTELLNKTCKEVSFTPEDAAMLDEILYRPDTVSIQGWVPTFVQKSKIWIRKHEV